MRAWRVVGGLAVLVVLSTPGWTASLPFAKMADGASFCMSGPAGGSSQAALCDGGICPIDSVECITDAPARPCAGKAKLKNDRCISSPIGSTCGDGLALHGGTCTATPTCAPDQILVGGSCSRPPSAACDNGLVLSGGRCIGTPECAAGTLQPETGVCVDVVAKEGAPFRNGLPDGYAPVNGRPAEWVRPITEEAFAAAARHAAKGEALAELRTGFLKSGALEDLADMAKDALGDRSQCRINKDERSGGQRWNNERCQALADLISYREVISDYLREKSSKSDGCPKVARTADQFRIGARGDVIEGVAGYFRESSVSRLCPDGTCGCDRMSERQATLMGGEGEMFGFYTKAMVTTAAGVQQTYHYFTPAPRWAETAKEITCADGRQPVGGVCQWQDVVRRDGECPADSIVDSRGQCAKPPVFSCGPGTVLDGTLCKASPACPKGSRLQGTVCRQIPIPVCADGATLLADGTCSAPPCEGGPYDGKRDKCLPSAPRCPLGQDLACRQAGGKKMCSAMACRSLPAGDISVLSLGEGAPEGRRDDMTGRCLGSVEHFRGETVFGDSGARAMAQGRAISLGEQCLAESRMLGCLSRQAAYCVFPNAQAKKAHALLRKGADDVCDGVDAQELVKVPAQELRKIGLDLPALLRLAQENASCLP